MKITKRELRRIIKEEYEIVYGKQPKRSARRKPTARKQKRTKALNEFARRAYRLLREAGLSESAAKKNALRLRAQKARK